MEVLFGVSGFFLGLSLWQWGEIRRLKDELNEEKLEGYTSRERLYGAWKEGAVIPTTEQLNPADVAEMDNPPLNSVLTAIVDEWTNPEVRDGLTRAFQTAVAEGFTPNQIYERYISGQYDRRPAGPM